MRGAWAALGVVLLCSACVAPARPRCSSPEVPPAPSTSVGEDTLGVAVRRDGVVAAFGLRPLRLAAAPAAGREMRLWSSVGPGIPHLFVRVVADGAGGREQWIAWWRRRGDDAGEDAFMEAFHRRMRQEWRCGPISHRAGVEWCTLVERTGPAAQPLLARLDSLRAWNAPEPGPPIFVQIDGQSLDVEVWVADAYHSVRYGDRALRDDSAAVGLRRAVFGSGL